MVCLFAAPWIQLSVGAGNGWPHNALRHHCLMPISCHFRDCKALLVTESDSCKRRYNKYSDLHPSLPLSPHSWLPTSTWEGHPTAVGTSRHSGSYLMTQSRRRQFLWSYQDEQWACTSAVLFTWATGNLLRERSHNKTLLTKTAYVNDQDYLIRML